MTTYLLDFTQTPLKPAAGGQLHRVKVGDGDHDNIEGAIVDLVKQYGLVGETDTFVPAALVAVNAIVPNFSNSLHKVQVEPASAAQDYKPRPRLPTWEEVLAVFPQATNHDPSDDGGDTCFSLSPVHVDLQLSDDAERPYGVYVTWQGHVTTGTVWGKDWAALVRESGAAVREHFKIKATIFNAADAALAAALGDTP